MNPEDFLDGIGSPAGPKTTQQLASWIVDGNRYPTYKKFEQIFEKFEEKHKDVGNGYLYYKKDFAYPKDIDGIFDYFRFVRACINDSQLPITNVEFAKCWGIKYLDGDYKGLHNHTPGQQMTAVLFLTGAQSSFKYPLAGHLVTLCPGDYDIDYRTFAPEPGACVIMDGKVFHGTYPALGERRAFVSDFTYDIVEGI